MPTLVPLIVSIALCIAIVLVALPFIDLLDKVRLPRRRRPASPHPDHRDLQTGPAFAPLKMADSGQRWPSQMPRRTPALSLPSWPSESWPNNPFPASTHYVAPEPLTSFTKAPPLAEAKLLADKEPMMQAVQVDVAPEPVAPTSKPRTQPKSRQKGPSKPQQKPAPQAARRSGSKAPSASDGPPDVEQILAIAEDPGRGLAGAVDFVRQQTGWSFQRAAQHVATTLRQRR